MGIDGLLQLLRPITHRKSITEYRGMRVAVDAYCWLHKGVYSCNFTLDTRYLNFCAKMLAMLLAAGVKPLFVFDGAKLPMKQDTEKTREENRKEKLREAESMRHEGKYEQARRAFVQGIEVTPQMAHKFIHLLKSEKVDYVVAPYEADAQIAYLFLTKQVELAITEDSDLLAFGCTRAMYKLDSDGFGDEINLLECKHHSRLCNLVAQEDTLLKTCILSGCDYLPSIKGIGLKKALKFTSRTSNLDEILRLLAFESKLDPFFSYNNLSSFIINIIQMIQN